ncbi:TPA: trypsin-like peptidase domain-containing protein [Raoultella ornithinolytica]|nr:trypsin-like peptidase domain-containing protein [Raoultella ornithinolytica]HDX8333745.1 trypsin-like peptidase domain-containing protein [Raoultella ornithinolytica]
MLDTEMKVATCKIECGDEYGTGLLITPKIVLTARHCVANAIESDSELSIIFDFGSPILAMKAHVLGHDAKLDIALVELEIECNISPVKLSGILPLGGSRFYSYGWPVTKLTMGHRLEGTIIQTFDRPKLRSDIEISIDEALSLNDYKGFSGASVVCNGTCVGVIRVSVEKTIGVVSVFSMRTFLNEHGLNVETNNDGYKRKDLASRNSFIKQFDKFAIEQENSYLFINGAHGIGKSTFCEIYTPIDSSLEHFGTYSFTPPKSSKNATRLAQPQEFFNWLNMQVSIFTTGSPGRIENGDYPELITKTEQLFIKLSGVYSSRNVKGVLFIDGLDEVERQDAEALNKFIGLLPMTLLPGLVIVLSAPNYEQVATRLGKRLGVEACISMPSLTDNDVKDYCYRALTGVHVSSKTINLICERAQGHPLYLRYLIDLVNSGASEDEICELPLIDGSIRKYYDLLWLKLMEDNDAINLLAIVVRLRWGIPINQFTKILNPNEQSILISTLARIRHLLLSPNQTTIYHSSFSDFLLEKTALREQDIQSRLVEYCKKQKDEKYSVLNLIYHGLKSEGQDKALLVTLCTQNWVDDCVYQGVEPDTILEDLKGILKVATELGSLVETVRILLLNQRIRFRYNTLFAQSADLTANALISIGKNQEVLQHVSRYKQLIIPLEEALTIALKLVDSHSYMEALELLSIVEKNLTEELEQVFNGNGLSYRVFLDIYDLQLQQYLLRIRAKDKNSHASLANFQFYWMKAIDESSKDEETSKHLRSEMMTYMLAASMCLSGRYMSLDQIRKLYNGPLEEIAEPIVFSAILYKGLCDNYGINTDKVLLEQVFPDIKILISECCNEKIKVHPSVIDCFLSLGASSDIILALGEISSDKPSPITFIADDNISIDHSKLENGFAAWRLKAFIDTEFTYPDLVTISPRTWLNGLNSMYSVVAWCDGSARRFKEAGDNIGLQKVWEILKKDIFDYLKFSLAQRVQWEDAYGLPESIVPQLYQSLTILITDVYPDKISELLNFVEGQFSSQCGIYSEGFRRTLNLILANIVNKPMDLNTEDQVFSLVERWKEFVVNNLENRYELVPELLSIIPFYTKLDASDEANKTYQLVLSFSMGPSWYKEDQFGLSVTVLQSLSHTSSLVSGELSKIAGLLDAAAGEMTFQRFVRYAKRDFLKALCSRNEFSSAVKYFIRQTYGTLEQMHQEVTKGDIDRISAIKGTRFPGGALDEQDSILYLINPLISSADWQLCWALLESFQFGDSRYINRFAESYKLLIDKVSGDDNALTMIMDRLEVICESEFENKKDCSEFIVLIASSIPERYTETFEARFTNYMVLPEPQRTTLTIPEENTVKANNRANEQKEDSDAIYMPGLFGSRTSISEATTSLAKVEKYLRRRNFSEAQKEIISGLTLIQSGGWSIWGGQVSKVADGQSLLLRTNGSVCDLVKLYSPLILNERHTENWRIANDLIEWLASYSSNDEQAELLRVTNEHTKLMVGAADKETAGYRFLDERDDNELPHCLATLLLHVIDHPLWLRREKASEMLIWLSRSYPDFVRLFGAKAFSMDTGIHPDVICGALDQMSITKQIWETLAQELDFNSIQQGCKHVGRYSVLIRIAREAAMKDFESAAEALSKLRGRLCNTVDNSRLMDVDLPSWAECIKPSWLRLEKLGLTSAYVLTQAESALKDVCLPLSIEVCLELEQLLAEGYYENTKYPNRWSDRVRYVFQVAYTDVANESECKHIENVFRKYNPTRLDNLRISSFDSPALQWLHSKEPKPLHGNSIYLDYFERVWFEGQLRLVRLTAYLSDNPENLPLPSGRFLSLDKPSLDKTCVIDTCANVEALPAYFGSFTPAIPTTHFMQITGATSSNLKRNWWKSGRLKEKYEGAPFNEGCYLSIDANALRLPHGFKLIWVFELDLKPIGLVSFG